jgi:hypothetical protein
MISVDRLNANALKPFVLSAERPCRARRRQKEQVIARSKSDVAISWRTSSGRSEIASSPRSSQ